MAALQLPFRSLPCSCLIKCEVNAWVRLRSPTQTKMCPGRKRGVSAVGPWGAAVTSRAQPGPETPVCKETVALWGDAAPFSSQLPCKKRLFPRHHPPPGWHQGRVTAGGADGWQRSITETITPVSMLAPDPRRPLTGRYLP